MNEMATSPLVICYANLSSISDDDTVSFWIEATLEMELF